MPLGLDEHKERFEWRLPPEPVLTSRSIRAANNHTDISRKVPSFGVGFERLGSRLSPELPPSAERLVALRCCGGLGSRGGLGSGERLTRECLPRRRLRFEPPARGLPLCERLLLLDRRKDLGWGGGGEGGGREGVGRV